MPTYAVGDIQGCLQPLKCVLKKVSFSTDRDRLWLVGDLVNRGPKSLQTLRFLYDRRDNIHSVLGNHDLHLLAVAQGHRPMSKSDTLQSILEAPDCDKLLRWLRNLPLVHCDSDLNFTMVHAGIPPAWSIADAVRYSREVEAALQGVEAEKFLTHMYGNQPSLWSEDLTGIARLRLITNYCTRMRFCDAEGRLELISKGGLTSGLPGYAAWFSHANRRAASDRIIFGHWAALEGRAETENIYALDTGCVWGGSMSMLRLEDEARFACKC